MRLIRPILAVFLLGALAQAGLGCSDEESGSNGELLALVIGAPLAPPEGVDAQTLRTPPGSLTYKRDIRVKLVQNGVGIDGLDVVFAVGTRNEDGQPIGTVNNATQTTTGGGFAQLPNRNWVLARHSEFVNDPADIQEEEVQSLVVMVDGGEVPTVEWTNMSVPRPISIVTDEQ